MSRANDDLRRVDLVKDEQHLDVRELREPLERRRCELRAQPDAGFLTAP